MRGLLLIGALLVSSGATAEPDELVMQARQQVKSFATTLGATLKASMQKDGPVAAIAVCNTAAPQIASQLSTDGWQVARTSLKVRNPDNVADAWEAQVMQDFAARIEAGESPAKMEATATTDGEFRYMKAIPTAGLCVTCHGSVLAQPVEAKLAELYPQDQARGFNVGDLRGAFTLRKTLED